MTESKAAAKGMLTGKGSNIMFPNDDTTSAIRVLDAVNKIGSIAVWESQDIGTPFIFTKQFK
ncbi:hypothetical protein D3C86_1522980 [compost metagenome]